MRQMAALIPDENQGSVTKEGSAVGWATHRIPYIASLRLSF